MPTPLLEHPLAPTVTPRHRHPMLSQPKAVAAVIMDAAAKASPASEVVTH